jgi:RNA polymerase sigma factor (sigma-70 family)
MSDSPRLFPTTSQTLLSLIHDVDSRTREVSVARFCTVYYPSIYGYARALGLSEPDAQDLVQDFFVEVVRDGLLQRFDPLKNTRLSTWLMACFRNQVNSHHAARKTQKRGGSSEFVEFNPEHAEHSYRAAHLAHLAPEPTFDLMLAREIWQAAKATLLHKHARKGNRDLVADLLPFTLLDRWPPRPLPTQEELAARHQTTLVKLKAFFNRTLKAQSRSRFDEECLRDCPGITEADIQHLWNLLCKYGED